MLVVVTCLSYARNLTKNFTRDLITLHTHHLSLLKMQQILKKKSNRYLLTTYYVPGTEDKVNKVFHCEAAITTFNKSTELVSRRVRI